MKEIKEKLLSLINTCSEEELKSISNALLEIANHGKISKIFNQSLSSLIDKKLD